MLASFKGHTAIVQLLLEMGADTESNNAVRETKRKNHTHLHMWLTRWFGEYTPCDLFQSLWLRLVHVRPGAWPERRCFFCLKVVWQSVLGCQMQEENVFLFLFDTLFLLKESWESTEELRVRSSVLKNWKKKKEGKKWRFSLLVHYSQSLPESCRMRILRLVSKSQRSIFELKCRQKFNLSPGTSSFFTFKFLPCVPARASSY